jgi:DNA-binding transcriptional LysR family regulator
LLDRTAQGIEPTVYGSALLKWAVTIFDDVRQGMREIEFLADPTSGEVRVGCLEMMNAGLLPGVIDRLSRQYPRIEFTVLQAPTIAAQYHDLRERRVDLVFSRMMMPIQGEDLDSEILCEDPLIVVASPDSKWVRRRSIQLAELVDEPWCLVSSQSPLWPVVVAAFHARGLAMPRLAVRSNSPHLSYAMAHTGRFLAVAAASTLRMSGKRLGLKAVPVDLPIHPGPIGIVILKNRTISPAVKLFIDCARDVAKSLAKKS